MLVRVKAYDSAGRLWKSKELSFPMAIAEINRLKTFVLLTKIYIHSRKKQKTFSTQKPKNVPIYYTCSDGKRSWTTPINLKHYPLVAHFADGSTLQIS